MTQKLKFVLKHDRFPDAVGTNMVEVEVEVDGAGAEIASVEDLIGIVRDEAGSAITRAVGAHIVGHGSFASHEAYLARIDRFAAGTAIVGVSLVGDAASYGVLGRYEHGGEYAGLASGVTAAEAEFQARWTMAQAQGTVTTDFDGFIEAMIGIEVVHCLPFPMSDDELRDELQALVDEARAGEVSGGILDLGDALQALIDEALAGARSDAVCAPSGPRP